MSKKGNNFEKNRELFEEGLGNISDRFIKEAADPKAGKVGFFHRRPSGSVGKALVTAAALSVAMLIFIMSIPVFNTYFRHTPPVSSGDIYGNAAANGNAGSPGAIDKMDGDLDVQEEPDMAETQGKDSYKTELNVGTAWDTIGDDTYAIDWDGYVWCAYAGTLVPIRQHLTCSCMPTITTTTYPDSCIPEWTTGAPYDETSPPDYFDHEHQLFGTEEVVPPCKSGRIYVSCSICGYSYTETFPAVSEHQIVNGECTLCGEIIYSTTPEPIGFVLCFYDLKDGSGGVGVYAKNYDGVSDYTGCGIIFDANEIIKIPAEFNGKPVLKVDSYAFHGLEIESVYFEGSNVTVIGDHAFDGCKSLLKVVIPDSVKIIEEQAFTGCVSLGSLKLSNGLTEIGKRAFKECKSLKSVIIPPSVDKIGEYAFDGCSNLEKVVFKRDLASIDFEYNAFNGTIYIKKLIAGDIEYPTEETSPVSEDITYDSEDIVPDSEDIPPVLDEVSLVPDENPPVSEDIYPVPTDETTPVW